MKSNIKYCRIDNYQFTTRANIIVIFPNHLADTRTPPQYNKSFFPCNTPISCLHHITIARHQIFKKSELKIRLEDKKSSKLSMWISRQKWQIAAHLRNKLPGPVEDRSQIPGFFWIFWIEDWIRSGSFRWSYHSRPLLGTGQECCGGHAMSVFACNN